MPFTQTGNRVLGALQTLSPQHFAEMAPLLKPVQIEPGTVLVNPAATPAAVYFVETGLISVVFHAASGQTMEIGFVGSDGITTTAWLLGGNPPPYAFVAHVPVTAQRIETVDLRRILHTGSPHPLQSLVSLYGQQLIEQLGVSVVCARLHTATERLARLLLSMATRLESNTIPRTHESLAAVIGGPRSMVTEGIGTLKRAGCVDASRGRLTILDRDALREHACECYETERAFRMAYARRLGAATISA